MICVIDDLTSESLTSACTLEINLPDDDWFVLDGTAVGLHFMRLNRDEESTASSARSLSHGVSVRHEWQQSVSVVLLVEPSI